MQITEVRVYSNSDTKPVGVQANCSVTIDGVFVLHQILVVRAKNGNLFIRFPQEKRTSKEGTRIYTDICHPLDTDTREYIQDTVLSAYEEAMGYDENELTGDDTTSDTN